MRAAVDSGLATGSRLGVRGREALGGGTAAVYTVEAGILNDTGVSDQNGRLFGRQAFVGLEGPLGRVTLGRQYNLVYETLTDVADPSMAAWLAMPATWSPTPPSATTTPSNTARRARAA
jgi:predicted porin